MKKLLLLALSLSLACLLAAQTEVGIHPTQIGLFGASSGDVMTASPGASGGVWTPLATAQSNLNYWTKSGSNLTYTAGTVTASGWVMEPDLLRYTGANLSVAIGTATTGAALTATSYYNVAIGPAALNAYTGINNIAIGNNALTDATASNNLAFGSDAAKLLTTGTRNVALGSSSLAGGIVTGNDNLALGYNALNATTSGSGNATVGSYAGRYLTTGNYNALIGSQAGEDLTTGSSNIGIGLYSLDANTTGARNVAIGQSALSNRLGNNNVAIGNLAGENSTATNTTGALLLGANAGQGRALADYTFVLGYGNPALLEGNLTNGWMNVKTKLGIGMGSVVPNYALDVAGNDINIATGFGLRINGTATAGQFLRGNGTRFVSSAIQLADLPSGINTNTYTAGTGISLTGVAPNITIANTGDTDASNDLTTASTAGGDLSGTFANLQIAANAIGTTEVANTAITPAKLDRTYLETIPATQATDAEVAAAIAASDAADGDRSATNELEIPASTTGYLPYYNTTSTLAGTSAVQTDATNVGFGMAQIANYRVAIAGRMQITGIGAITDAAAAALELLNTDPTFGERWQIHSTNTGTLLLRANSTGVSALTLAPSGDVQVGYHLAVGTRSNIATEGLAGYNTAGTLSTVLLGTGLSYNTTTGSLSNSGDTNPADDLTAITAFGGDLSGTASSLQLVVSSVTTAEIAPNTIEADDIAFSAVTADEIVDGGVWASELYGGSSASPHTYPTRAPSGGGLTWVTRSATIAIPVVSGATALPNSGLPITTYEGYWRVPTQYDGWTCTRVTYSAAVAGGGSGAYEVSTKRTRGGSSATGNTVSFGPSDEQKETTAIWDLQVGDLFRVNYISTSSGTVPTGLVVQYFLEKI